MENKLKVNIDDAFRFLVACLRQGAASQRRAYDVWLPHVWGRYWLDVLKRKRENQGRNLEVLSAPFYDAAAELCRRGILRLGIRHGNETGCEPGRDGSGYSITDLGRNWLRAAQEYDYLPIEPTGFSKQLADAGTKLGPGYLQRSLEAVRCWGAHAYLACCAMCGAAAESILLAIAVAKNGDEEAVLRSYRAAGGRTKVANFIIGSKSRGVQDEFRGYLGLLAYWRDEASHGQVSDIDERDAFTSLALLLRFALFADTRWQELTKTS